MHEEVASIECTGRNNQLIHFSSTSLWQMYTNVTDNQMVWWIVNAIKLHASSLARIFHSSLRLLWKYTRATYRVNEVQEKKVHIYLKKTFLSYRLEHCLRLHRSMELKNLLPSRMVVIEKRWVESNQINDGHTFLSLSLPISFSRSVYTFTLTSRMHTPFLFCVSV